ncbi:hypothetical protein SAMN04487970_103034 [Paenibacillus tianmuensis]|uniref:Uncharacterized protein n=1 Tax=Paenibacillus tianmuensis TaxID=624147 RepID=A0A1G4SKE5_9BACL|nr:hypothetical protein [Paenibacillus tianmuensis]SCW69694.1 hypothetical protein SAMN04487970_103034 [Paenibacillus tianmuensis]
MVGKDSKSLLSPQELEALTHRPEGNGAGSDGRAELESELERLRLETARLDLTVARLIERVEQLELWLESHSAYEAVGGVSEASAAGEWNARETAAAKSVTAPPAPEEPTLSRVRTYGRKKRS